MCCFIDYKSLTSWDFNFIFNMLSIWLYLQVELSFFLFFVPVIKDLVKCVGVTFEHVSETTELDAKNID